MSKHTKNQLGFTLVELLVAIVIIVILSTIGIASFNTANQRNEVQNQAKEITSLLRKLRTDSVAAVKPAGSCQDSGTVYGTYVSFGKNTLGPDTVTYGVSCWGATDTDNYSTIGTFILKEGLDIESAYENLTIFFSFDGNLVYYDLSSGEQLTKTQITNPSSGEVVDQAVYPIVKIVIRQGNNVFYSVAINPSGLICNEPITPPLDAGDYQSSNCAANP